MCRAKEDGGRRCPAHTPEARRLKRAHTRARDKYKGPKDVPCTEPGCTEGILRWIDEYDVFHQELCGVCGGSGYLNDAAGRMRV